MADREISGPDWLFFPVELVHRRIRTAEKMSHLPHLLEWDLDPDLLLSQMALRDPLIRRERQTPLDNRVMKESLGKKSRKKDNWSADKELKETWYECFTRRFPWDFNDKDSPSPTDSLSNLWTAERDRRLHFDLNRMNPLKPPEAYLQTAFDDEK